MVHRQESRQSYIQCVYLFPPLVPILDGIYKTFITGHPKHITILQLLGKCDYIVVKEGYLPNVPLGSFTKRPCVYAIYSSLKSLLFHFR